MAIKFKISDVWYVGPSPSSSGQFCISGYLRSKAHHKRNSGLYYGRCIAQFLLWPSPAALSHLYTPGNFFLVNLYVKVQLLGNLACVSLDRNLRYY